MIYNTKAIILRSIRYGDTSLVVTAFTERFGVQTYIVNAARSAKKSSAKAILFQPSAQLEMQAYHQEQKAMNRIKEANWAFLYQHILSDVVKNSIALFMIELLHKTLKQPEQNIDLFYFCEDALQQLDQASMEVAANFPLYFVLQLPHFSGLQIQDDFMPGKREILDLQEGRFVSSVPQHTYYLENENAQLTAELLRIMQPGELADIKLNKNIRRVLLAAYISYFQLHIQDFGNLKTLPIIQEVLG
ncbi:MAG: DNA repair protein RecO [Niastella sp.]|nr:DNA repair protein RecO [Niastella sp.]